MTEKRYFKREWEEEYYIFDSKTISEKKFDEKVEYEDYQAFVDSMQGDEVVDRLNALHEENKHLNNIISAIEKGSCRSIDSFLDDYCTDEMLKEFDLE